MQDRLAKGAILDLSIAVIAHFCLNNRKDDEKFIDSYTTKQVNRVKTALNELLTPYIHGSNGERILKQINSIQTRLKQKGGEFNVTDVGLAFDLLYLGFAPNERKSDRVFTPLAEFWKKYQKTLLSVSSKADNGKEYEIYASDSFDVANIYLDEIATLR